MGTLYLVATPIGNLEDISYRAVRILSEVDYIAAEDTRHTIKLLNHLEITKPLISYHEHNKREMGPRILDDLIQGKDVALVTDAGTPAISDPGEDLVRLCHQSDVTVKITSIPGPAALINGLILSGKDTRRFVFEGFVPMQKKERQERLEMLALETRTMILYEAPHKLKNTLKDLEKTLGSERGITLIRELTKKFEEVYETTLGEALIHYGDEAPRGEFVLVIEGMDPEVVKESMQQVITAMSLEDHLQHYLDAGYTQKDAIKAVAKDRNQPKRVIYDYFHKG